MLKRLAMREYLPLAGALVYWLVVAVALGREGLAVIFAAMLVSSAAHAAAFVNLRKPIVRQLAANGGDSAIWKGALPYEIGSLALEVFFVGATVMLLVRAGYAEILLPVLVAATGLPARHRGLLTAFAQHRGHQTDVTRVIRNVGGALCALVAWRFDAPPLAYAAILSLREWFAFLALVAILFRRAVPSRAVPKKGSFDLHSIAAATRRLGSRRLAYRALKPLFSGLLGPVGAGALRTLRGIGVLGRHSIPQSQVRLGATLMTLATLAAVLLVFAHGPTLLHLVIGCVLLRFMCTSGNLAAWSWITPPPDESDSSTQDEDDDDL